MIFTSFSLKRFSWIFSVPISVYFSIMVLGVVLRGAPEPAFLRFSHYTAEDGLSNSNVRALIQDNLGFIWIGTDSGLNRYDGYRFRHYLNNPDLPNSLINNTVYGLYLDQGGRLWVGTQQGLSCYIPSLDSFTNYLLDPVNPNDNVANRISGMKEDARGLLLVATEAGFVYEYQAEAKKFRCLNNHSFGLIKAMEVDPGGAVWLGTSENLFHFDPVSLEMTKYERSIKRREGPSDHYISTLCLIGDQLWIGTDIDGLKLFDIKKRTLSDYSSEYFYENAIKSIYQDDRGFVWIGDDGGIRLYPDSGILDYRRFWHSDLDESTVAEASANCIFVDRQNNLWVGSAFGGLNVAVVEKEFYSLTQVPDDPTSLTKKNVTSILQDSQKRLWIGYYNSGIDLFSADRSSKKYFIAEPGQKEGLGLGSVFCIMEDHSGRIWIGTYSGGLQYYDPSTETFIGYLHNQDDPNSISGNDVRAIVSDYRHQLWIASHGTGLNRFIADSEQFKRYSHDNFQTRNSLINDWIFTLEFDWKGSLWVGTPTGISILDINKASFRNIEPQPNSPGGLSDPWINVLFEDSRRTMWVGTNNGLNRYFAEKETFKKYTDRDGLPNSTVNGIVEDAEGFLWLSTNMGISRFDPKTDTFRNYSVADGLQSNEFYPRSCFVTSDGEIFFGGNNGITHFFPEQIKDNVDPPKVVITDIKLFNKSLGPGSGTEFADLVPEAVEITREVTLSHEMNVITLEFAALNFIHPEKNEYAYKLENFENSWNFVGNKREATYTNLDPGNYQFRIKASNNDGIWNETGQTLSIIVTPPYWATLTFQLTFLLIFGFIIFILIRTRFRAIRAQKIHLEKEVSERTADLASANAALKEQQLKNSRQNRELSAHQNNLETLVIERTRELELAKIKAEASDKLKSAFLANMSHEIRTPMNAILGFLGILHRRKLSHEEQARMIGIIHNSGHALLSIIDDILDLSKIEAGQFELKHTTFRVNNVLTELLTIFQQRQNRGDDTGCEVRLRIDQDLVDQDANSHLNNNIYIHSDAGRLRQVLTNLISNALKFTESGYVEFGCNRATCLETRSSVLHFYVEDTGIGIIKSDYMRIFERFQKAERNPKKLFPGAGLGLTICKNLVEMLGGTIWVHSVSGKGSAFHFTMPYDLGNLPEMQPQVSSTKALVEANYDWKEKRFLVAEDEIHNYDLIVYILGPTAVELVRAVTGIEAVEKARSQYFDLVLMDIKMPEMDGNEATRLIKKTNPDLPIVAQTAYAQQAERDKCMEAGCDDYIAKPFDPDELIELIHRNLA